MLRPPNSGATANSLLRGPATQGGAAVQYDREVLQV